MKLEFVTCVEQKNKLSEFALANTSETIVTSECEARACEHVLNTS
mgnify:CR=1 FL=1